MPYLSLADAKIYYEVKGEGQPVVLIHGMGLSHTNWKEQVESLIIHGFQTITFDIRGHGRSTATKAFSKEQNIIAQLTNDLYQLLKQLNISRASLIGYSTGTVICQQFAVSYPHMVDRLVLTGAFPKISNLYLYSKFLLSLGLTAVNAKQILAKSVSRSNGKDQRQINEFKQEASKVQRKEVLRLLRASLAFDCGDDLKKLSIPILVTYGGNERYMMTYRRKYLELLSSHVEVCLFPQVNHAVLTKATADYTAVLLDYLIAEIH